MSQAIKVDSRFATPYDTARILGVSKSRTEALIKIAKRYTDRILKNQASGNSQSAVNGHSKRKSAATVVGKSSGRDAGTKISATRSKNRKAKR